MRGDGGTGQLGASRCEGHRQGERGASTLPVTKGVLG